MRNKMTSNNSIAKRKLNLSLEQTPKRLRSSKVVVGNSDSSPEKSTVVLAVSDEDEITSNFSIKSFYGSGKKRKVSSDINNKDHTARPHLTAELIVVLTDINHTRSSLRQSSKKMSMNKTTEENLPVKNTTPKFASSKVIPKRSATVPKRSKTYSISTTDPGSPELQRGNTRKESMNSTPVSGNKFFKHKSPGSKLKSGEKNSYASIIVKRGFNLKFIPNRLHSKIIASKGKGKSTKQKMARKVKKAPKLKEFQFGSSEESDETEDMNSKFIRKMDRTCYSPMRSITSDSPVSPELVDSGMKVSDTSLEKSEAMEEYSEETNTVFQNSEDLVSSNLTSDSACHSDGTEKSIKEQIGEKDSANHSFVSEDLFSARSECSEVSSVHDTVSLISEDLFTGTLSRRSVSPVVTNGETTLDGSESSVKQSATNGKYFSIFTQKTPTSSPMQQNLRDSITSGSPRPSPRTSSRLLKLAKCQDNKEQLILDAGQKKIGARQCEVCSMVYTLADPSDETTHARFHQSFLSALKFTGWKKERVVQEYPDDCNRILLVLPDDLKYAVKKVEAINRIMSQDLGFSEGAAMFRPSCKAFLFVSDEKRIDGCCIAEGITEGYRVIPEGTHSRAAKSQGRPWCCQTTAERASVGISRIWVNHDQRRRGVASKLLDCVRHCFEYGVVISKEKMAFSDPTPDGKFLATCYSGKNDFLVYKYTS